MTRQESVACWYGQPLEQVRRWTPNAVDAFYRNGVARGYLVTP